MDASITHGKIKKNYKKPSAKKVRGSSKSADRSAIFGNNLKRLMEHHEISFNKLGQAVGITRTHLMGLTNGRYSNPKLHTIDKVSKFFKVKIAELIGEQEIDFRNRPKSLELDYDCEN